MVALAATVDHVDVQRRRLLGQREDVVRTAVGRRCVQEVDERDHRDDPARAIGAGRHRCGLEVAGDRQEAGGLVGVQLDPLPVVVDERDLRHRPNLPPGSRLSVVRPHGPAYAPPMRAAVFPGDGSIEIAERPSPTPGPGEVLVRVHGAGLNRADLVQRAGFYPAPPGVPADIPGMEFSGEVAAIGDGVDGLRAGDRVFGIVGGGAQAEELVAPESCCVVVPAHLDPVEAGGIPEGFITPHDAMRTRAGLQPGEHVLVHAVGSGVGTAVVQLAKALGNTVTGTARTPDKLERAAALGLDHGVLAPDPFDAPTLGQAVLDAGGHADVVVELVGGGYLDVDLAVTAVQGRIVVVGTLAGGNVEVPLLTLMSKRLALHGTVLRARSIEQKAAATAAFAAEVLPLLHDQQLQPVVDRILPLDAAA